MTEILQLHPMGKTPFEDIKAKYRMSVRFYHELGLQAKSLHCGTTSK